MAWFQLTGSNPTLPSNYTLYTSDPETLCPGIEQICAIQATGDVNNKPVFTSALQNEMILALHNQAPSTNVLLKNRP